MLESVMAMEIKWRDEIKEMLARDAANPPALGKIVAIGSSILRGWSELPTDMQPLPVYNRAFGGSRTWEVLHFMDRILLPLEPRVVLLYVGSNDIADGDDGAQVEAHVREIVWRIHAVLPATEILYLSVIRAPKKADRFSIVDDTNARIQSFAESCACMRFFNINPPLFDSTGQPRSGFFQPDDVHLERPGYEALRDHIQPVLSGVWESVAG